MKLCVHIAGFENTEKRRKATHKETHKETHKVTHNKTGDNKSQLDTSALTSLRCGVHHDQKDTFHYLNTIWRVRSLVLDEAANVVLSHVEPI